MKTLRISLFILALFSFSLFATPVTFNDQFPGTSCVDGTCDVIGDPLHFDIQKVTVTKSGSSLTTDLFFNYYNNTLDQYNGFGVNTNVGDLFFTIGDQLTYGVPLMSHGSSPNVSPFVGPTLTQGTMYLIGTNGTLTAGQVLNYPSLYYRASEIVWLNNQGTLTNAGSGSVNIATLGDGVTNAKLQVTFTMASVPTDLGNAIDNGNYGIHFASATCGNDVIDGEVPEPSTLFSFLAGAGLLGISWIKRKH